MKYTVQSGKYVFKNFIYLIPFAILPAIFWAISTDEQAIDGVIRAIFEGDIHSWSFAALFRAISIFNFATWKSVVFGVVGVLVTIPCVALLMALLEKHMRIGKRTFNGLWGKLNDNLISTTGCVLLLLGIYEIWSLLIAAVLFFVSRITIAAVAYVFAGVLYIALHVILMVIISTIYLWLPCMQITGFRAYEALVYSYHLTGQFQLRLVVTQLVILLLTEVVISVFAIFVPFYFVFNVFLALIYAAIILIFCVRMQIAYFDRDHIERADLMEYYQR